MFKIFKSILLIIWIIDILNINININGIEYLNANILDVNIPINFLAWSLIWLLIPSSDTTRIKIRRNNNEI